MEMKRLVIAVVAAGAALAAAAMPTKKELQKAQEMVNDVTAADVAALKARSKTPAEVAAKHMELATQAGSEAEKYLLLQGAFKLYAKAGDYEGAANALGTMNREIADMMPEVIVEIYNRAIFSSMKEKAPKLHAIKEAARRQVTYRKLLAKAEAAVKANPKDPAAQKKLGECHAELGNWPKALDAFALADGTLAKTAKAEKDGTAAPQASGDFWWDYESGDEMSTYKLHAAELYRTALADDSFKGLARTRADQRVKEAEEVGVVLPQKDKERSSSINMADGLLAHRWSFDKDFVDSVGKVEGRKLGKNVRLVGGRCVCRPGGLDLGKVLESVAGSFTIECWYREEGRVYGTRVIASGLIRQKGNRELLWATGTGKEGYFDSGNAQPKRGTAEMQFELRHRYYLAVSYNGKEVVAYKADLDGDRCLRSYCAPQNEVWATDTFRIGINCADPSGEKGEDLAVADYEELRIWKTALSKTDIEKSYKLGPDKVPVVDVDSIASAKGAGAVGREEGKGPDDKLVSTAVKAPTPKCKMVNGRPAPLKFELAKGVDLELEGCPAGKFTMGYAAGMWNDDGKAAPKHDVTITRPFWIGKYQVTRGQAKALGLSMIDWHLEVQSAFDGKGGDTCSAVMTFDNINAFCRKLTEKFAAEIPTGYVFRLVSNAEWEYASKAGNYSEKNPAMLYSGHKESPYILTRHDKLELLKKKNIEWKRSPCELPPFPGGLKRPNGWGIFDMLGNHPEVTMDRIPKNAPDVVNYHGQGDVGVIRAITYAKQELDPFWYCETDWNLLVRGRWDNYLLMEGIPADRIQWKGGHGHAFRICLGPDLVAEKKAKGK